MKNTLLALALWLFSQYACQAQPVPTRRYNVMKINIPMLPCQTYKVHYERMLTKAWSINAAVRYKPNNFYSQAELDVEDEQVVMRTELRHYPSADSVRWAPKGWFVGPHLNLGRVIQKDAWELSYVGTGVIGGYQYITRYGLSIEVLAGSSPSTTFPSYWYNKNTLLYSRLYHTSYFGFQLGWAF